MEQYIPWLLSVVSILIALATFTNKLTKDRDMDRENNIKMNVKLDNLCNNTSQILIKQEKTEDRIMNIETKLAVQERDIKTAFNLIDEIKKV